MNKEMPIGFAMSLSMDMEAMEYFTSLTREKRDELIDYVSQPLEGDANKTRIEDVIHSLHNHMLHDKFY